jgi:hypothetical protein|tara:strand:- start:208 stop:735 length:528 start_codon:yes stop_codon:yes gene_type:complete
MKFILKNLSIILLLFFVSSCGGDKGGMFPSAEKSPTNAKERVAKNIEEGRGLRFSMKNGEGGTNFSFASSNPLWRATLEKLDFIPLQNVDYAGGIIITDWYSDGSSNEELKVAVRFLTPEVRSDALEVVIYKKECKIDNNCKTTKIEGKLNSEIKASILRRAAQLEIESKDNKKD